jgi:hypothetical protein
MRLRRAVSELLVGIGLRAAQVIQHGLTPGAHRLTEAVLVLVERDAPPRPRLALRRRGGRRVGCGQGGGAGFRRGRSASDKPQHHHADEHAAHRGKLSQLETEDAAGNVYVSGSGSASRIDLATGSIDILEDGLRDPTSLDLIEGAAWVAEGQLRHLFDMTAPGLPFEVVRVPL